MYTNFSHNNKPEEDCAKKITEILKFSNKTEIQSIHDNDQNLNELINDTPEVKNLADDKEALIASNKSIAEYNLTLQPRLAQAKSQLAATYGNAKQIQQDFEETKRQFDGLSGQQSLDTTLALLQTESAKSEEDSEKTAEDFLAGDMEVDSFLSLYSQQRTLAHSRKIKVEKMQEIIRNSQSGLGYTSNSPYPQHASNQQLPSQSAYKVASQMASRSYPTSNPAMGLNSWSTPYPQNSFGGMPNPSTYLNRH